MNYQYEYKGCHATISTGQTADDKWKYDVVVEPVPYVGTNVGKFPEPNFETEDEAHLAAERQAECRIDNRVVKSIAKGLP